MLKSIAKFRRDRRGVAALEFAMIVPIMLILFFGSVELSELMAVNKRTETVAASLADVVARDTVVVNSEITDFWKAADTLIFPNSKVPLKMRVTSLEFTTAGKARVLWSDGSGLTGHGVGSELTLGSKIDGICGGPSVIYVETEYDYVPLIGVFLKVNYDLDHQQFACPRVVDFVARAAS
jgi:Flp pilus assembly protein TadG